MGSILETEEVGTRLLQLIRWISSSATVVISTPDKSGESRVWRAIGFENLWPKARHISQVQEAMWGVIHSGKYQVLRLDPPEGSEFESLAGLFLPLRVRGCTIGVLEVYGPEYIAEEERDILLSLAAKVAEELCGRFGRDFPIAGELATSPLRCLAGEEHGEQAGGHSEANQRLPHPLTPREIDVLCLIADGKTNRQISTTLFVSVSAVKLHIQRILMKLEVSNRTQAAVRAVELRIIPPPGP